LTNLNISSSTGTLGSLTLNGPLTLPATGASSDLIYSGTALLLDADNDGNFFSGANAGNLATTGAGGTENTAVGDFALNADTTGSFNTANGYQALNANTTGQANTADGTGALFGNVSGFYNTAVGLSALRGNTNGIANTGIGAQALFANGNGNANVALGGFAAQAATNETGIVAVGFDALQNENAANQGTGSGNGENTAIGYQALRLDTAGAGNTAAGFQAMLNNTVGAGNTAVGDLALLASTSGTNNIAIGFQAGNNFTTTESSNIDIGNPGVAGDYNTIRIGGSQTAAYLAGVYGTSPSGVSSPVVINANGQLGTGAGGGPLVQSLNGLSGAVTLTAGANVTISPSGNTLTIAGNAGSGVSFAPVSIPGTTQTAVPNTSYVATSASLTTINLPATANVGDMVQITGAGAGGWQIPGGNLFIDIPWTKQTSGLPGYGNWTSVASSADGTHLVAVNGGGGIYTSANSGATWTQQTSGLPGYGTWTSVASSADGTHLVAVNSGGRIYTSANSGATWTQQTSGLPGYENWTSVAPSADGTHLVAVNGGGGIYTSADSGVTWTQQTSGLPTSAHWYSVASSADGTHLVAVIWVGGIYTSANSGATWTQQTSGPPTSANWSSVASSADGTHLVAVNVGGGIYTSADSGATWTQQTSGLPTSANWSSVASSADGTHLVAVNVGDGIYTAVLAPFSGGQGSSAQFQYLGNGYWQPVKENGTWTVNGNNVYYNVGSVGVGTTTPANKLDVQGNADFSGNVGIGTASPQVSLDVAGGIHARGGTPGAFGANNNGYFFGSPGDSDSGMSSLGDGEVEFYNNNSEVMRLMSGNVGIGNTSPAHLLVVGNTGGTYCDGTTWVNGSDRNSKEDFAVIKPAEVLAKVAALPITEWKYKVEAGGGKHLGPMAQDFHAAFGLNGADDKHISTVDEGGVALAAIQGLNEKLEARSQKLEAENAKLQQSVAELKQLVQALAKKK